MHSKLGEFLAWGDNFRREFKKELRLIIVVTLGFTIAFTWRQTVFDTAQDFVQRLTHIQSSAALSILTSGFITLISLIIILLTSKLLRDNPHL
ncbi:hypothetical protein J4461_01850 [Candidatus Pacearchaeota archaeon]|nr:hypothetical protein [Candidatus Pacearchaeota archaeon]